MTAPEEITELTGRFNRNREAYKSVKYNETQLRREFIDPFFKALGWDVDNTAGNAEAYKDAIHEDAIKIGSATKAPDYSFRIGGTRKFFVEAKKPSVNIAEDIGPAYQLRRYAWSAKLPLSILTDFEEFAVYDCRTKPDKSDKASTARIMHLTDRDYLTRWEEIASVFSKEAVLKGSFDRYADSTRLKRGTAGVDAAFLREIETWREMLARNIALRNPHLTQRELNTAVTVTINRIIFLRICEDRGIETYGQLMALRNGTNIYERLVKIYYNADDKYNSGLFHFRTEKDRAASPDTLTLNLAIDDKTLKDIFRSLYYPDSPYEFSVLPADILGQVYEQFLGKVIHLTAGHQARVEDKPEVKKAGGVYYTPTYIVDYIVKNTVGKLLPSMNSSSDSTPARSRKAITPRQASEIRILDPACGSGSFLLGAYQYLLDWHLNWYIGNEPEKWIKGKSPVLCRGPVGDWRLTTSERKRILLNNIHGVDIDPQAVEVTKLSLLLKVLEGENEETLTNQFKLFHERALPDLGNNIKCGNSLIGPDFYDKQQMGLFDDEERYRINVFDWEKEFPEIMKAGGFDAVIGNPPYLNIDDTWGRNDARLQAIKQTYPEIYNDKTDILFYFLAKATILSKGYVSFIVSRAFLEAYKADKLRANLVKRISLQEFIDFRNYYVFKGVGITTGIINLHTRTEPGTFPVYKFLREDIPSYVLESHLNDNECFEELKICQTSLSSAPWTFVSDTARLLNNKIDSIGVTVGQILLVGQGMQTGKNEVFGKRTKEEITAWKLTKGTYYKRASNSDIQRYSIRDHEEYLLYLEGISDFKMLPHDVQEYLAAHGKELKERAAYQRGDCLWWRFTWPLHKEWYERNKILCPYLSKENRFALDPDREFIGLTDTTVLFDNGQPEDIRYILGLLNSKVLSYRFKSIGKLKSGGILEYFWNSVSKLPLRRIKFSDRADKSRRDRMVALVEQMLYLHKKLTAAKTDHDKTILQRQIDATDSQIDRLVYDLYELTEEEIRIVEGAN